MAVPEFILRLRSAVGHEPLWLTGVSAVVVGPAGRLLLGQRSDDRSWAVVSGVLEPGEQPAVAVVREVLEETGVRVAVRALTSVHADPPVTYPNGDVAQYLDLTFWCVPEDGVETEAVVGDDESLAVGWFEPSSLPEPLAETSRQRIGRTLEHIAEHRRTGAPVPPRFVR